MKKFCREEKMPKYFLSFCRENFTLPAWKLKKVGEKKKSSAKKHKKYKKPFSRSLFIFSGNTGHHPGPESSVGRRPHGDWGLNILPGWCLAGNRPRNYAGVTWYYPFLNKLCPGQPGSWHSRGRVLDIFGVARPEFEKCAAADGLYFLDRK